MNYRSNLYYYIIQMPEQGERQSNVPNVAELIEEIQDLKKLADNKVGFASVAAILGDMIILLESISKDPTRSETCLVYTILSTNLERLWDVAKAEDVQWGSNPSYLLDFMKEMIPLFTLIRSWV
jgi:hypothetical protein